jgi:hypothetical protein
VSGGHDLRVVIGGPTMRDVAAFVSEKLAPIDHVTATNTHFLLKSYEVIQGGRPDSGGSAAG